MTFKLKFDQQAQTCTHITMYPSGAAHELVQALESNNLSCLLHYRGAEEGSTIQLDEAPWFDAVEAFEAFYGRRITYRRGGTAPPETIRVVSRRTTE